MKMRVVFVEVVKMDYIGVRRNHSENFRFIEKTLRVERITGGDYPFIDRFNGKRLAGDQRNAPENDAESSSADLFTDLVVSLQ